MTPAAAASPRRPAGRSRTTSAGLSVAPRARWARSRDGAAQGRLANQLQHRLAARGRGHLLGDRRQPDHQRGAQRAKVGAQPERAAARGGAAAVHQAVALVARAHRHRPRRGAQLFGVWLCGRGDRYAARRRVRRCKRGHRMRVSRRAVPSARFVWRHVHCRGLGARRDRRARDGARHGGWRLCAAREWRRLPLVHGLRAARARRDLAAAAKGAA